MALTYFVPAIYDAALSVLSFALPLYLLATGVSAVTIGVLVAVPSSVQIFARVPAGLAAGKLGNVTAMLAGCAMMTASGMLIANAPAGAVVLFVAVAQVLSGLARASFWPANQAHLFEIAGDRIASYIGMYNFVVTLGGMAGALLAGALLDRAGARLAFWMLAVLSFLSGALLVAGRKRTAVRLGHGPSLLPSPHQGLRASAGAQIPRVLSSPGVWLAGLSCILSVIPFTVTTSFYPVLLRGLDMSAASISLLATVRVGSLALFSLLTGPFISPRWRPAMLGSAGLLGAAGMAMIPTVSGTGLGFLPMLLFGFCGGAMHNLQMAIAGEAVAPVDRALSMAVVGSIGNVAMALTPVWQGSMVDRGLLAGSFPLIGLVLAVLSVVCWTWTRRLTPSRQVLVPDLEVPAPTQP